MNYEYDMARLTTVKKVQKPSDVPMGQHWAIIVYEQESVYVEGDERSKTAPGHGYPAHTVTHDTFKHYVTQVKEGWLAAIKILAENTEMKNKYVAFEVPRLAKVSLSVNVEVD